MSPNLDAIRKMLGDTLAPNGLPVHENFAKWFGDSKVVDVKGHPLVVYHGTTKDFNQFIAGQGDIGMHFGTTSQANRRLENGGVYELSRLIPVYLNIRNPLRTKDAGDWNTDNGVTNILTDRMMDDDAFSDAYEKAIETADPAKGIRGVLEEMGYDGIVYGNVGEEVLDFGEEAGDDSWIAFHPEQVKSAIGNNGEFDAASSTLTDYRHGSLTQEEQEKDTTLRDCERMRA